MFSHPRRKKCLFSKVVSLFVVITFSFSLIVPPNTYAQVVVPTTNILNLPNPGSMIPLSHSFVPTTIKGVKIYPDNPLRFDFIIDTGEADLQGDELEKESIKLIKYFLTALTVPEDDLWVNLSPYEKDRIVAEEFGQTEMGRDLLAQDYILKQITSSLIYPEDTLGQRFWDRVYKKAFDLYGTTDVPVNTFNKVWILPKKAAVYSNGDTVFVTKSILKVMLEEDYLAAKEARRMMKDEISENASHVSHLASDVIKQVIIPELEREVNEGKNFAPLRQIYTSLILATWFKQNLKESLLGRVYFEKKRIEGVEVDDKQIKEKIYQQYLAAFKSGVYNFIKEEYDPHSDEVIPRKYFSGGADLKFVDAGVAVDPASEVSYNGGVLAAVNLEARGQNLPAELTTSRGDARQSLIGEVSPSDISDGGQGDKGDSGLAADLMGSLTPSGRRAAKERADTLIKALNNLDEYGQTKDVVTTLLDYLRVEKDKRVKKAINDRLFDIESTAVGKEVVEHVRKERFDEENKLKNETVMVDGKRERKILRIRKLGKQRTATAVLELFDFIDDAMDSSIVMEEAVNALGKIVKKIGKDKFAQIILGRAQQAREDMSTMGLRETDMVGASLLSNITDTDSYIKAEYDQTTLSFKPRYFPYVQDKMKKILMETKGFDKAEGVITAVTDQSGVAMIKLINDLGKKAVVFATRTLPPETKEAMEALGASVFQTHFGQQEILTYKQARQAAETFVKMTDYEAIFDPVDEMESGSTGNHGAGLQHTANEFGKQSVTFVSKWVPARKREDIMALGGKVIEVHESGTEIENYNGARLAAEHYHLKKLREAPNSSILVPHASPTVNSGYGVIMLEIYDWLKANGKLNEKTKIFAPVGEGGLAGSIAAVAYAVGLKNVEVVGAGTERFNSLELSMLAGYPVHARGDYDGSANAKEDGIAVPKVARFALLLGQIFAGEDGNFSTKTVTKDQMDAAIKLVHKDTGVKVEGAVGVAAGVALTDTGILDGVDNIITIATGQRVDLHEAGNFYDSSREQILTEVARAATDTNVQQRAAALNPLMIDAGDAGTVPRAQSFAFQLEKRLFDQLIDGGGTLFERVEALQEHIAVLSTQPQLQGTEIEDTIDTTIAELYGEPLQDDLTGASPEETTANLVRILQSVHQKLLIAQRRQELLEELRSSPDAFPKLDILKDQAVVLRGPGSVGKIILKGLLETGAKVIVSERQDSQDNIGTLLQEFASYVDSGRMTILIETEIKDEAGKETGQFTRKYLNPFEYISSRLNEMGITEDTGIQGLVTASQNHSIGIDDVPILKEIGIKWVSSVENDQFAGDKVEVSRALKKAGIVAGVDFEENSGGVRAALDGIIEQDTTDTFIRNDVSQIVASNFDEQEWTNNSGHEIAVRKAKETINRWEREGIAVDKLSQVESQHDIEDLEKRFEGEIPLSFLRSPEEMEKTRRNPKRLDGLVLESGAKINVYAYESEIPADIRSAWDNHYAIFKFTQPDDKVSWLGIHRLTKIESPIDILDGRYRTIGGSRMEQYDNELEPFRLAMELSHEMSLKNAAAGLTIGGSKNILVAPSNLEPDYREITGDSKILERRLFLMADAKTNKSMAQLIGGGPFLAQDVNMSKEDADLRASIAQSAPNIAIEHGTGGKLPAPRTAVTSYSATVTSAIYAEGKAAVSGDAGVAVAVQTAYDRGETDEFVEPTVLLDAAGDPVGRVKKNDYVSIVNFRPDRVRQITRVFTGEQIEGMNSQDLDLDVTTMTEYQEGLVPEDHVVIPPLILKETSGEVVSKAGLRQLRVAETEKYAHVTYFINGGIEEALEREDRILIPSPPVEKYDETPEMKTVEVTDAVINGIDQGYNSIKVNYAAGDMIGHTGNFAAAVKAVETIDENLGRLVDHANKNGYSVVITADHGNVEKMVDEHGAPHTAHSTNLVPFIFIPSQDVRGEGTVKSGGTLVDFAPTVIDILGLEKPSEMTGQSLIEGFDFSETEPKVIEIILDGWGINEDREDPSDATRIANTPHMDRFLASQLDGKIEAHGVAVGLPEGLMGNSEVGHLTIGSGRVPPQSIERINQAISDGSFFNKGALVEAMRRAKAQQDKQGDDTPNFHLFALVSEGGVHSDMGHIYAELELAKQIGLKNVYVHAILDGRDTPQTSGKEYIAQLEAEAKKIGVGVIADIVGRFYAMDRDKRWERTQKAYDLYVEGEAEHSWTDSSSDVLLDKRDDGTAFVTMNRPRKKNAFSTNMQALLLENLQKLNKDDSVKTIVITGEGDMFSAGADLTERASMNDEQKTQAVELLNKLFDELANSPKRTVAAINGAALGGGLEFALAADYRIALREGTQGDKRRPTTFVLPETGLGILPGAGGTQRLPRIVDPVLAKKMVLTGKGKDVDYAKAIGLVDEVIDDMSEFDATLKRVVKSEPRRFFREEPYHIGDYSYDLVIDKKQNGKVWVKTKVNINPKETPEVVLQNLETDHDVKAIIFEGDDARFIHDHEIAEAIKKVSKPTIAVIKGTISNDGLKLARAFDFHIQPGLGDDINYGELSRKEAVRLGYLDKNVFMPSAVSREIDNILTSLSSVAPTSYAMAKEAIRRGLNTDEAPAMNGENRRTIENPAYTVARSQPYYQQALAAFAKREKPVYAWDTEAMERIVRAKYSLPPEANRGDAGTVAGRGDAGQAPESGDFDVPAEHGTLDALLEAARKEVNKPKTMTGYDISVRHRTVLHRKIDEAQSAIGANPYMFKIVEPTDGEPPIKINEDVIRHFAFLSTVAIDAFLMGILTGREKIIGIHSDAFETYLLKALIDGWVHMKLKPYVGQSDFTDEHVRLLAYYFSDSVIGGEGYRFLDLDQREEASELVDAFLGPKTETSPIPMEDRKQFGKEISALQLIREDNRDVLFEKTGYSLDRFSGEVAKTQREIAWLVEQFKEVRLSVVGDSYTIGTGTSPDKSWPAVLTKRLQSRGVNINLVANPSKNTKTTQYALDRELEVFQQSNPTLGTLLIGVNDYVQGVTPDDFRNNLRELIKGMSEALPAKDRLVVITIPDYTVTPAGGQFHDYVMKPIAEGGRGQTVELEVFNDIIREEAKRQGARIVESTHLSEDMKTDSTLISDDRLHPSAKGYAFWEKLIFAEISKMTDILSDVGEVDDFTPPEARDKLQLYATPDDFVSAIRFGDVKLDDWLTLVMEPTDEEKKMGMQEGQRRLVRFGSLVLKNGKGDVLDITNSLDTIEEFGVTEGTFNLSDGSSFNAFDVQKIYKGIDEIRYVPIGDSSGIGTGISADKAWPSVLVKNLKSYGLHMITNPSRAGATTKSAIEEQLPILKDTGADFATLSLGLNDYTKGVSPEEFRKNYARLLDGTLEILPSKERLVVITLPDYTKTPGGKELHIKVKTPVDQGGSGQTAELEEFNQIIIELAQERGLHISNSYGLSLQATNDVDGKLTADDDLHPSAKGHGQWERIINRAVRGALADAGFEWKPDSPSTGSGQGDSGTAVSAPGGIDLTPKNFDLQSEGQQIEFSVPENFQNIENLPIDGFAPVIFSITPVTNFPLLLGIREEEEESIDAVDGKELSKAI